MPGLLTLHTDLKSLKYGQDRPGGGDSGQPYIKTDINTVDSGFNRLRLTAFDDGLVRGGIVGAANAAVVDTLRISKFLYTDIKGPLFIVKQVGLQLSNPRLETRAIPSIGGTGLFGSVINAGIGFLNNNGIGPTRIYNLGVNTLAQIPVNALGGHIVRHGLSPIPNENSYYINVVRSNNKTNIIPSQLINTAVSTVFSLFGLPNLAPKIFPDNFIKSIVNSDNRLVNLTTKFNLNPRITGVPSLNKDPNIIAKYLGGPESTYGILNTVIKRHGSSTQKEDWTANNYAVKEAKEENKDTNKLAITDLNRNLSRDTVKNGPSSYPQVEAPVIPTNVYGNMKTYAEIAKANQLTNSNVQNLLVQAAATFFAGAAGAASFKNLPPVNQFRIISSGSDGRPLKNENGIGFSTSTITPGEKIVYQNSYREKVTINKPNWNAASRAVRVGSGRKDSINLTPLFIAEGGQDSLVVKINGVDYTINDLVKFRIEAINTDNPEQSTFMVFRAYITSFDDSTNANWDATKYIGRGEEFYIYNGFTRKINIGFKVAALSAGEMQPMYQKLNYLMSNLMPDYDEGKLMRGPFTKMTVGNWIDSQPGIINSLTYTISNDTPWEIALNEPTVAGGVKEMVLPHIIDVSMNFTPIGVHTQGTYQAPKKSSQQSNIAQNWNGGNEKASNYISSSAITAGSTSIEPSGKIAQQPSKVY
jgi:hypothetical protein